MAWGLVAGLVGGAAKKALGRATRWATRQALGSGARRAVATTAAGAVTGVAAAGLGRVVNRFGGGGGQGGGNFGPDLNPFGPDQRTGAFFGFGGRKKYRRMNYLNQRALKKSIRRVQGFEKIVRQAFSVSKGSLQLKKRRSY